MKPRTQIILAGALLIALVVWSSARPGARPASAGRSSGACCPFLPTMDGRSLPSVTNGTMVNCNPKPAAPAATNPPGQQVIAYYFHGTVRCETCLKIEQQAKETIERRFGTELNAKRMVFKPVNYELPENAHFLHDYKLPCPSLVLVQQKDGADEKWTLLGDTWELVGDTAKFNRYLETEVNKSLRGGANSKTNTVPAPL